MILTNDTPAPSPNPLVSLVSHLERPSDQDGLGDDPYFPDPYFPNPYSLL